MWSLDCPEEEPGEPIRRSVGRGLPKDMCDGAWKLQGPAHSGTLSGPRPSPSAPPPPGDSCCVLEGRAVQSKPEASCTVPFPLLQKLQSQHLAAFVGRSSWQGSQGQCALCARQGELLRPHRARGWVGPSGLPCVPGRLRLWVRGSPLGRVVIALP